MFLSGQNSNFESVFQTVKDRKVNTNEICHFILKVKITPNNVEVSQTEEQKTKLLFNFPVLFETVDNNIFAYTEDDTTIVFTLNEQKLVIINSKIVWVVYSKIPTILKID